MLLRKYNWLLMAMAACTSILHAQAAAPVLLTAGNRACQPFLSNTFYPGSNVPMVLTGDVNGDKIPDLVSVSRAGVTILIGSGDGTFQTGATYPIGGADFSGGAVAGDFNHDGKLDIVVATSPAMIGHGSSTVNVFLGNGDGTFQSPRRSPVQTGISFLSAGDFNHDGNLDLAGVSYVGPGATPVEVLLGRGDGTFQAPVDYQVASLSWAITVADFNGDGNPDLAVSNTGDLEGGGEHTVSVFLGKGDGTFGPATLFQTGFAPIGLLAVDLNGDGKMDLATANYQSGTASVLLGNGDGTFAAPVSYSTGHPYSPYYVAAIRYGSGPPNLAVSGLAGVFTLVNKGNGTFRKAQGYNPGGAGSLVVADFNRDGRADVALGAGDGSAGVGIAILLGNGDASFATSTAYVGVPNMVSVAEGDFNGDGIPDLAVGDLDGPYFLGIMLGDGKGGFSSPVNLYTLAEGVTGIAAGDLNGDGKLDLAVTIFNGQVQILLGNGDGSFSSGSALDLYQKSPPSSGYIALADFNGDGKLDIAVTSPGAFNGSPGVVSISLGNGDGTFQPVVGYAIEPTPGPTNVLGGLAVADFNGDGKLDFAVGDNVLNMLRVLLGNGDGTFKAGPQTPVAPQVNSLAVADFNGDGKLDVAAGEPSTIQILLGKGDGLFRPGATLHAPAGWVTAADFNGDGKTDLVSLVNAEQMQFFPGHGDGTFGSGPLAFTAVGQYQFALGDLNGDGFPDLVTPGVQGGAVSVLLNRCGK